MLHLILFVFLHDQIVDLLNDFILVLPLADLGEDVFLELEHGRAHDFVVVIKSIVAHLLFELDIVV